MNLALLLAMLSALPAGSLVAEPHGIRMVTSEATHADATAIEAIDDLALSSRFPQLFAAMSATFGGNVDAALLAEVPELAALRGGDASENAGMDVAGELASMIEDVSNNELAPSWRGLRLDFLRGAAALAVLQDQATLPMRVPAAALWGLVRQGISGLLGEVLAARDAGKAPTPLQRRVEHEQKALGAFPHLSGHAASVGGLLSPDGFVD